jgi:lipopolysaccharide export system permease protein
MKILDRYILKSFLVPFLATFFIVLFVLVMQALWLAFESIAGKGISLFFIFKFLYYTSLIVSAQALPIAVLLSSIMALGNLSENYEFAAAKSASISLLRLLRPLIVLTLILSVFNFFFLNNVYPYAILKQKNLMVNIRKKKPALALIPGSFNTEIPNYQIKFDEKYGEEENYLKKVLIYDLSSGRGNKKVITAETGEIASEEGSKYMTLILYDGYYYEDHYTAIRSVKQVDKMPASSAKFKEYTFNIDISSFSEDDLDEEKFKNSYNMLSLRQLNDTIPLMKDHYDGYIESKSRSLYNKVAAHELYQKEDTILNNNLNPNIYENFDLNGKIGVINSAVNLVKGSINNIKAYTKTMKVKRKRLNLYDVEFYNRIAFSLSCLILFFVGAPLGSIIRKGGFGLPMILAICIYVIYFFANTFGRNLAEESSVTAIGGSWISTVVMVPFALLLTKRASKGMSLINISSINRAIRRVENLFVKSYQEEKPNYEEKVVITEEDRKIKEKMKALSDNKLIEVVQNYKQLSYTKGEREVVLEILEERGITKEELIYTGRFENQNRRAALRSFWMFKKNSKIAIIFYLCSLILNLAFAILANNLRIDPTVTLIVQIIILYLFNIIFLFYGIKSILNYMRLNKLLNMKLEVGAIGAFFLFGVPFYFILYFYTRKEVKKKIAALR